MRLTIDGKGLHESDPLRAENAFRSRPGPGGETGGTGKPGTDGTIPRAADDSSRDTPFHETGRRPAGCKCRTLPSGGPLRERNGQKEGMGVIHSRGVRQLNFRVAVGTDGTIPVFGFWGPNPSGSTLRRPVAPGWDGAGAVAGFRRLRCGRIMGISPH